MDRPPTPFDLRVFAVLQAAFVPLLAWLFTGRTSVLPTWWMILALATALVGAAGLIRPSVVAPYRTAWTTALYPMQWIVSRTLLAIVFFGVVTPLAFVVRSRKKTDNTGWQPHADSATTHRLWKMW